MSVEKLKLVNGDEVISEVIDEGNMIKLIKPSKIAMTMEGLELIPWDMLSNEEEFTINASHVITRNEPVIEIINAYNSQYGSGIEIIKENPGGGIIV